MSNTLPKLLCLMPLYNHVDSLEKSVNSVMEQITNFSYKLLIIDDLSTDGSYELALDLQKKYPAKIEVIRNKENLKLLRSMFNAYNKLKNIDYFCVLDPDDWYTDMNKFQEAVDFLEKNNDYSIFCHNVFLLKNGIKTEYIKTDIKEKSFSFYDYLSKKQVFFPQTSGSIYRNIYFKDKYDDSYSKILQYDYPESFRADGFRNIWYLKKGKAYFLNKCCSVYNYNTNGIWSSLNIIQQNLINIELLISEGDFFKDDSVFFYKNALDLLNNTLNLEEYNLFKNNESYNERIEKIKRKLEKITNSP